MHNLQQQVKDQEKEILQLKIESYELCSINEQYSEDNERLNKVANEMERVISGEQEKLSKGRSEIQDLQELTKHLETEM